MARNFTASHLTDSLTVFRQYKKLAEAAMAQATDEQLYATLDPEANSIALVVKHITGNMRSRWTNFLTTDGEKPDRKSIGGLPPAKAASASPSTYCAGNSRMASFMSTSPACAFSVGVNTWRDFSGVMP
jgi:hypothetical protein